MRRIPAQHFIAALSVSAAFAQGQELAPGVTVQERQRPEVDGAAHRLGAFELATSLTFGSERDDNILAERTEPLADTSLWLEPAFELDSNWTRHALGVAGDFRAVRYREYSTEDHEDNQLRLAARLDMRDSANLSLDLSGANGTEGRESPDDRGGDRRTPVETDVARIAYVNERARLRLNLETEQTRLDFDDVFRSSDASTINNDDRDRRETLARARIGYRVATDYAFFVQAAANDRRYVQQLDDDGFDRSSNGWELGVGVALDRSRVLFGDFFAGYRKQDFNDARFEDVEGPTFGAELTWNVTGLTTLTALAERILEDTTIVGVSGIEATRFRLVSDHELRRNLILSLAVERKEEDFQGVDQKDDIRGATFTVRYLMNRRLHLLGGYRSERRSSTAPEPLAFEYAKDVYFLELKGNL